MMNGMMRETLLSGTARRAEIPGWEAAGKTGTTQDFRDAWFVGYTGSLVAGVWLGNDDSGPTKRVMGSNLPVEVWGRFMKVALQGAQPVPLPGLGPMSAPSGTPMAGLSNDSPGRRMAAAPSGEWIPPTPQERGFLSRLFGN
jgi:penicillin-binding protein 1A